MKLIKRAFALAVLFMVSVTAVAAERPTPVENFKFKDMDGNSHQFSEYRGKWVIVNYWATYCGPCIAELPALNSVAKRFKDKVVVLGMEAGETPAAELKQFVAQKKITYPVIPTQDSTMFALGLLYGVPTTFVVNPQGEIEGTHMGAITSVMLQNYLRNDKSATASKETDANCITGVC
ncbi:TlpA family protein disulfide reductase [Thiothrix litoralis]|jgi:thiol-disulfide isomerase/thioredoxin|uniref:TlpA family protein disulfide reductase n=1 Tax=Thiothrix litoralis TaxID=2891210 RepID=A0ABX7WQI6_9GAMM|nr:TlpA disulfide reductase family protein [Thiothrix litoralis]QTR46121.1 TlpA family protein disulfide reductase [Thiothrix litoralis]